MSYLFLIAILVAVSIAAGSKVVTLHESNFEHLTQASTGATTGDWFVKFYAPWCGHCKTLAPIWDDLADELDTDGEGGYTNVAKVDVTQNRGLGSRFEIKGFPTLLYFSKGEIFKYKGRRGISELTAFAKGGFKEVDSTAVPTKVNFFQKIMDEYKASVANAGKDFRRGNYFTTDTLFTFVPIFSFIIILGFVLLAVVAGKPKKSNKQA